MKLDLHTLSLDELTALRKDVDAAIDNYEARKREEALAELKEVAKKHGFDIADLTSSKGKGGKSVAAIRYRDPENPKATWTGRGRKPNWLVKALDAGKSIEDFAI